MARYTGPVCRLCRRERHEASSKGDEVRHDALPDRAPPVPARAARPRPHRAPAASTCSSCGRSRRRSRIYGLLEKQFRNLYEEANRQQGITGENLLRMLELRLDNVVFRAGWASSRTRPASSCSHGHVNVNGKRVDDPVLPGAQGRRRRARATRRAR